jgi:hypothetical protein
LLGFLAIVVAFVAVMTNTYIRLQAAQPLENLSVRVVQPVYSGQTTLEFEGTFDRPVACRLTDFNLRLSNADTGQVIVLNSQNLVRAPATEKGPGDSLVVEFAVTLPDSIRSGFWTPEFDGEYLCRLGIFLDQKHETFSIAGFQVTPAKKTTK